MLKVLTLAALGLGSVLPQAQGEDPARALRDAAAKVVTASKLVGSGSDLKAFDKNVDDAMKLYYGAGQKDDVRASVKAELIAAFKTARARCIRTAQDKAKGAGPWKHLVSLRA